MLSCVLSHVIFVLILWGWHFIVFVFVFVLDQKIFNNPDIFTFPVCVICSYSKTIDRWDKISLFTWNSLVTVPDFQCLRRFIINVDPFWRFLHCVPLGSVSSIFEEYFSLLFRVTVHKRKKITFVGPCITILCQYMSNRMQLYTVYFICKLLYIFRVASSPIISWIWFACIRKPVPTPPCSRQVSLTVD